MKWKEKNIPNLNGKVIIVTGGNSGLGYESVRALAENGARVIMACRSFKKGEKAKAKIDQAEGTIEVMRLDLQDFESIKAFAEAFKKKYSRLDVLMNNAGIMIPPYKLTSAGVESQLATNHLGHFMLTALLLDVIKATPQSRVVSVSSLAHRKGEFDVNHINYNEGADYDPMVAYRRSKLANLFFAYELQRFFETQNIDAISVVAHPGVAPTNLANHTMSFLVQSLVRPMARLLLQRVRIGALAQLRAAVDADVKGADFYGPCGKGEWRGAPVLVQSNDLSHDEDIAKQLWQYSEKVIGFRFK
jgi:NAD(P)-dependent dehydrogenase (short-subunit alcohol dehydrogenase family)